MTAERRLPIAIGASLLVNLAVWAAVGSAVVYRVAAPPPPIEIQRVIVNREGKRTVKVVKPEQVKKKVARIVKEHHLTPPKPAPARTETRPKPTARKTAPTKPFAKPIPPPPQGAHNRVLTSKPTPNAPSKPQDFTALAGGNATQGKPTGAQAPGSAVTNPPEPPKMEPPKVDPPKTDPPKTAPPVSDPGPKSEPPKSDPPPKVEPPKTELPKRKGPTRDAQHSNEVNPSIPDSLKEGEFKKFVRVRVDIAADGSFTVTLRTSSGNEEVDRRVLDALKKWTWKPKLVEGDPVDSTQLFRFDFEVK